MKVEPHQLKAFLLDANMKLVKPGLEGQIYVGGNNLSDGYIDNIIENSKKFIQLRLNDKLERLYKTGDLAYLNSKDDLVYTGREDYEFKCNGMRINPSEIEECLESNTAVKTATIVFYENSIHVYIVFNNLSISEDELKRFLKRKLPQYMIPSVYHYLDNLPLTERGKIDKSLLIDQLKAENDVGCNFSNIKETLLKIWENILQIPTINENENFFELGGDSIHALQIASQARSAGIKFNPADIYKYPTILQIAQVCESLTVSDNKLKIKFDVPNKVSPTPIQQWFFSLPLSNRLYFSQSFIFDVDPQTNIERLKNAIDKTIQSQAIFDGFWKYDNNMWFFIPLQRRTSLLFDVIYADSNDLQSQIISQTESTLNIETGRFVAFNLFIDAHENPYKLHFAAHHIAMDGVSWRILVKNIHFHYHNLSRTENKNYDYIKWASRVNQRTNLISDNIKKYWFESPWIEKYHLPSNMINNKGSELWKDHHEYSFSLGSSDTEKLRQQVLKNCGVKINAVLLAALYKAWFRVTSKKDLVLILEGHGREQSVLFEDDIKFTETIGWFTALFPVILNSENIDDIQDMLDYIPNRGVEFLPILYNLMDQTARKAFGCIPIKFNYLSEFSSIDSNKILSFSQKVDHIMDDLSNMSCDIDIEGMIINKQLKFTALVSDKVNQENAELFFSFYKEELLNIIRKFSSITHEVFCLLPLQKNIYYQCKRIKDFELYLINAKILFEGDFQTNDIVLAWKKIILSYDFFRLKLSDFFSNEQLYQYTEILSEKSEYPIKVIDLTSGTPPDFNLKEIITKKQMEFSLKSNTFLFYIFIIKHSKNKFEILWMHHHIFIDGWTINFIVNQFIENHLQCNFKKTKSFLDSSKDLFSPGLVSDNFWNNYFDGKIKKMKNLCLNKQIKGKHCLNIYSLNEKLKNNICSLTKKLKISKNTLFQAVWGMALCCYFKTLSILYCSVFSLRDSEEPAGFYVNTLPIFFDCPDEGQNFDSWILTFQNDLGEIAKHKYPSLFDIFGENYELIDKGLLNTLFVYEDYSNLSLKNDSFKLKSIQIFEKTHFPITFLLREYTEIDIVMSFYDDFVDKKNAKNIMYLYISILQNICSEDFTISSYTDYYSLMMSEKLHIDACVD